MMKRYVMVAVLAVLVLGVFPSTDVHAMAAPAGNPVGWQRLVTHINASFLVASSSHNRVLEVGSSDTSGDTMIYYAVIDSQHRRVVARAATGGQITGIAIDDQRNRGYLIGSVTPPQAASQSTLWTVDLSSGRLLSHQPFSDAIGGSLIASAVDESTGILALLISQGQTCCYNPAWGALILLNPQTLWMRRIPLMGQPSWMTSEHNSRVVTVVTTPPTTNGGSSGTVITGWDARTGNQAWTRSYMYSAAGIADSPATSQIWLLAPGGLVTRISVQSGAIVGLLLVAGAPGTTGTYQGLWVDPARAIGYTAHTDTSSVPSQCNLVQLNPRAGSRRPIMINCETVIGITPRSGTILITPGGSLDAVDKTPQPSPVARHLGLSSDQFPNNSIVTLTVIEQRETVVFAGSVPDLNQETGSASAAGLVFVPVASSL